MRRHIPNLITLLNMAAGSIALFHVLQGHPRTALIFIGVAIVFDFLDGLSARLLKAASELGKQLDSLADLVSFGLVPAAMIYKLILSLAGASGDSSFSEMNTGDQFMILSVLIVPALAAIRLAKFNLQHLHHDFMGLPTPAFAIFWIGIYMDFNVNESIFGQEVNAWFVFVIMVVLSVFMVIPLPMLSLKTRNVKFRENFYQYLLLFLTLVIILFTGFPGLPLVILCYILLSLARIVLT